MSAGLFGKLPAKRDFVAVNAPRRFLETWEPWLQSGVATSKQTSGTAWARELQPRAHLALLARRRSLRRSADRRRHALGRRRRARLPAHRLRLRGRRQPGAARNRRQRPVVRGCGGAAAQRARRRRDARSGQRRWRPCRRRRSTPAPRPPPAAGSCPTAACWSTRPTARCRRPFSRPGASAIAAPSRRSHSGGRSAARASPRALCPISDFRRRPDFPTSSPAHSPKRRPLLQESRRD